MCCNSERQQTGWIPSSFYRFFPPAPSIGLLNAWQLKNAFDIFLFCHSLPLRSRVCFPLPAAGVFWSPPWKTIREPSVRTLEEVPNGQSWYANSSSSSSSSQNLSMALRLSWNEPRGPVHAGGKHLQHLKCYLYLHATVWTRSLISPKVII